MSDHTETLRYVLQQYDPYLSGRWDMHMIPFWSDGSSIGLKVLCYKHVGSQGAQMAGFLWKKVVAEMLTGVVAGTGIEAVGMPGGTGNGPFDNTATWIGKANVMHGVAGGPDAGMVGRMQVAGAKSAGDPHAIYHSIKAGGEVLMEAVVRIDGITSGTRYVVHAVTDAAHSDFVQEHVMDFDGWTNAKSYWVYANGVCYENGEAIGNAA